MTLIASSTSYINSCFYYIINYIFIVLIKWLITFIDVLITKVIINCRCFNHIINHIYKCFNYIIN